MDIYIYYAIRDADCALAQRRVHALQQQLIDAYQIRAHCKRRPETHDGLQTWMEIYLDVPSSFDSVIEPAAAAAGLTDMAQNGRHIEHFMELC
jgi:hypothetical protein